MEQEDNLEKAETTPWMAPTEIPMRPADDHKPKARVWTAILVPIIAIVGSVIVAGFVFVAGVFALGITLNPNDMDSVLQQVFEHPLGIWIAVLPGQLTFFAAAMAAAMLSPISTGRRLRLGTGKLPIWTWFVFLIATPLVGGVTSLIIDAMDIQLSEQLKMIQQLMTARTGLAFAVCVFLVAVVPGFVEEVLFRGYMQARLLQRWHPVAAILLSAFVFAVAHVDPLHACAVFPLGIWMGAVAYRAQSIWPAILCHFGNNLLSLVANQFEHESIRFGPIELAITGVCSIAMIVSLILIFRKSPSAASQQST